MTHLRDPGEEHDAYLRAALRHAPDAALLPPEALNEAILTLARSAATAAPLHAAPTTDAASPATPTAALQPSVPTSSAHAAARPSARVAQQASTWSAWRPLAMLWGWLGRPALATGFAGLMVATLVGVMWWGRPLDEALPQRPEPRTAAERIAPASVPAVLEPSAPSAADATAAATGREPDRLQQSRPGIAPVPRPPSMRDSAAAGKPAGRTVPEATKARRAEAANPTALTRESASALGAGKAGNPSGMPAPPATPAAMPPEQVPQAFPSPADRSTAASTRARDRVGETKRADAGAAAKAQLDPDPAVAAKTEPGPGPAIAATPSSVGALRPDAALPDATRADARRELRMAESTGGARLTLSPLAKNAQAVTAPSPLPALRAALASEPARWSWVDDDGTVRPAGPELQRWLARLEAAALAATNDLKAAASAADSNDAASADRPAAARTVMLLRDGERHTMLRLGAGVEAIPQLPAGARWQARLSARDAAALQSGIPAR